MAFPLLRHLRRQRQLLRHGRRALTALSIRQRLGPLAIGAGGFVVLAGLGLWQIDRLDWKRGVIAEAEARLAQPPAPLPATPDPARDDYRPVAVEGRFAGDELYHLTTRKPHGPGYDVIAPFVTEDGRRILVERGYVPEDRRDPASRAIPEGSQRIEGFLRWPDDVNLFTPDPDLENHIWFARNVPSLAGVAGTEPLLVVQAPSDARDWPRPAKTAVRIRNNHLQYALTWFATAAVWLAMALFWSIRQR